MWHSILRWILWFICIIYIVGKTGCYSMHTSLNFNKPIAYDSSVGDSTYSFQALTTFSTTSLFFKLFFFSSTLSTFASLGWRWEKHKKGGGWIVLAFSSFSPTEVTDQKQIDFSFWCDNQNLNAANKNREREREKEEGHKTIIQVPSTNRK